MGWATFWAIFSFLFFLFLAILGDFGRFWAILGDFGGICSQTHLVTLKRTEALTDDSCGLSEV
jgi:hypothetical protein